MKKHINARWRLWVALLTWSVLHGGASLAPPATIAPPTADKPPRVFVIDENELLFEELSREYNMLMLSACDNDIKKASQEWLNMLLKMEYYAERWNFKEQLYGVKMWAKVFCDKRGRIQHIAYALKPSSRAVDDALFQEFLERFLRVYRMEVRTSAGYSHYTSLSFPVQLRR